MLQLFVHAAELTVVRSRRVKGAEFLQPIASQLLQVTDQPPHGHQPRQVGLRGTSTAPPFNGYRVVGVLDHMHQGCDADEAN